MSTTEITSQGLTWAVTVTGEMFGRLVSTTFEGTLFECLAFRADHEDA